jgi:hypothetical protein
MGKDLYTIRVANRLAAVDIERNTVMVRSQLAQSGSGPDQLEEA